MQFDGWKKTTIGELCHFSSGHGFSTSDWAEEGLPIIRIQNLNGSREFNYYAGVPDPSWIVEPGELLFAWAGVKGVSFGPTIWAGPKGLLNQHIYRVRPRPGVELGWLNLALQLVTRQIETSAHGFKANLVHVRRSDITDQVCYLPPIDQQREIVEIVSVWDQAAKKLEQLISAKGRLKQGLMQQLMTGKRRFPEFASSPWKERAFGSFLRESRISGSNGTKARKLSVRLYALGVGAKEETRPGSSSTQYYRRRAGQFIYSKLDFLNGAFGIVPDHLDGYESTLDLPAFDICTSMDPRWLLYFVSREDFYRNQLGLANGGRKARRVNPEGLLGLIQKIPERREQAKIADTLRTLDQEGDLLRKQLFALEQQRKGLVQKLLTRETKVGTRPQ